MPQENFKIRKWAILVSPQTDNADRRGVGILIQRFFKTAQRASGRNSE